jgi:ABC-2 type transport system ATP-binding protein
MLPNRRRPPAQPFWALKNVTMEMREGRSLGVIGHNGAGKSTLLKILTRTMQPTTGSVTVHGRLSALIELGAGFHPDFTGRENIVLNASILGITRREIERRMADIIEFSGIAPFIDTPVKYYSSGMYARLGFSVAIHVDPEILIVDEVLAVGDQAFTERCLARIRQMKRSGVGILLVTHGLDAVETLMDDAIWLDHGQVRATGRPREVVRAYRSGTALEGVPPHDSAPLGGGAVAVRLETLKGQPGAHEGALWTGSAVTWRLVIDNSAAQSQEAHARLTVRRPDGLEVAALDTRDSGEPVWLKPGRNCLDVEIDSLLLVPGTYEVDALLARPDGTVLLRADALDSFLVRAATSHQGICVLPHRWSMVPR